MSHDLITYKHTLPLRGYWFAPLACALIYLHLAPLIAIPGTGGVRQLHMLQIVDLSALQTVAKTAAALTLITAGLAFMTGAYRASGPPLLLLFTGTAAIAVWITLMIMAASANDATPAPGTYGMLATLVITTLCAIPASRTTPARTPRRHTINTGITDYGYDYDDEPAPPPGRDHYE
jgi:hypothetical protein